MSWKSNLERDHTNEKLRRVLEGIDRVLGHAVKAVEITSVDTGPPAWLDSNDVIYLNRSKLPELNKLSAANLTTWLGANAHEVGHTLFSPRASSVLIRTIDKQTEAGLYPGLKRVENLIEDQRMERLVIARFRPWRTYLTQAAIDLITDGAETSGATQLGETWPWLVGRTWLDPDLRARARAAYPGDGPKLASLVGQYQRLADPGYDDAEQALDLLTQIWQLLVEHLDLSQIPAPSGCGVTEGKPLPSDAMGDEEVAMPATADDDVVPSAGSTEDDIQMSEAEAEAEAGEGEGESSDTDGGGDDTTVGTDDGEGAGSDDSDDGLPPAADETGEDNGKGAGNGVGNRPGDLPDIADQLHQQVMAETMTDIQVAEDLASLRTTLRDDRSGSRRSELKPAPKVRKGWMPSMVTRRQARNVGDHLRVLTDAALPQWERRVSSGKLSVSRFMRRHEAEPLDTMFDRFAQGLQDEVSLDVSILVDVSGSMSHLVRATSEAAWAIHQAVDRAEGDTTLIAFDHQSTLVSQTGRRPHPSKVRPFWASGGTNPTEALKDTWRRLRAVEAAHKLVVVVTDGDWFGGGDMVRQLNEYGVHTIGVMLDPSAAGRTVEENNREARKYGYKMGTTHTRVMADASGLTPLFERVVSDILERTLAAHAVG